MLKELVEYVVQQLVDAPESVSVVMSKEGEAIIFKISVDARDRGKVIGKDGYTIKALRAFLITVAPKDTRIMIDLVQAT